jgi:hypothetical protein
MLINAFSIQKALCWNCCSEMVFGSYRVFGGVLCVDVGRLIELFGMIDIRVEFLFPIMSSSFCADT